jgi:hypothetical protein
VFTPVGSSRRQKERIQRAQEHNRVVWLSVEAPGAAAVFTRAVDDGVFNTVVWDVVMESSW